jgi:hypothetical protein
MTSRIVLIAIIFAVCCVVSWLGFDHQAVIYTFVAGCVIYWSWVAYQRF